MFSSPGGTCFILSAAWRWQRDLAASAAVFLALSPARAGERLTQCTGITLASSLSRIGLGHRLVINPQDDGDEVTGFVEDAQMGSGQDTGII